MKAFQAGDFDQGENFVEKGLIVANCSGLSSRERVTFFKRLIQKDSGAIRKFEMEFERVLRYCRQQAHGKSTSTRSQVVASPNGQRDDASLSSRMGSLDLNWERHSMMESGIPAQQSNSNASGHTHGNQDTRAEIHRHSTGPVDRHRPRNVQDDSEQPSRRSSQAPRDDQKSGQRGARWTDRDSESFVPSIRGSRSDHEQFDAHFIRRDPRSAGNFFVIGRIFAILWHTEDTGSAGTDSSVYKSRVRNGEVVVSSLRKFAVVKQGHGFCWGVPISTYGNIGVSKAGFTASDIQAHAIIHPKGQPPAPLPREPGMRKRPIAFKPASSEMSLDKSSRINFSKVHTIEHNVKAMDIGMIVSDSMPWFTQYWKEHVNK